MILPASYLNGFAPRDGQPLYPSLWTGCVGGWNPGLGPTGLALRDWSGLGNNGTLTGNVSHGILGGKASLIYDSGTTTISSRSYSVPYTLSMWFHPTAASASYGTLISTGTSDGVWYYSNSRLTFYYSGADHFSDLGRVVQYQWNHFALVANDTAWRFIVNGVSETPVIVNHNLPMTTFGNDPGSEIFRGGIGDTRIYNRALSPNEIRLLATRPGIAYEMAPRRRSSVQVTVAPLRYNLFSGSIGNTDVIGAS